MLSVMLMTNMMLFLMMTMMISTMFEVMNLFFFYLVTWRHLLAGASLGFMGKTRLEETWTVLPKTANSCSCI